MSSLKNKLDKAYKGFVLPSSKELEEEVIGAILSYDTIFLGIASDFSRNLFFYEQNALIADAILDLYKKNSSVNMMTVYEYTKKIGTIDVIGGYQYISSTTTQIHKIAQIEQSVKMLQEYQLARSLIQLSHDLQAQIYAGDYEVFDLLANVIKELESLINNILKYKISSVKEIHNATIIKKIEQRRAGVKPGVISGFDRVDQFTNGWQKSDLIIVAGRPGMGKTALAVSLALNPAILNNEAIGIFSLEMAEEQLVGRMQSILSGYDVSDVIKNKLSEDEWIDLGFKADMLNNVKLFIDDTANITITEFKTKARKMVRENNVSLIIIDYLQLMRSGNNKIVREQEIAEISKSLKIIAKELKIPVIALSQLSRDVEKRGGSKKPTLSDLRESGQIEQDADMIIFCYRPEYYEITEYSVGNVDFNTDGLFMLIVAKHRNGDVGEIPLRFIKQQTKVVDYNYVFPVHNNISTNVMPKNLDFDNKITNGLSLSDDTPF